MPATDDTAYRTLLACGSRASPVTSDYHSLDESANAIIGTLTWRVQTNDGRYAVPRLDQCLLAFPHTRFNIDIKAPGAVAPLWRLIQEHDAADRVCVGSFSMQRLRAFRALAGDRVATAAGPAEVAALRFRPGRVPPGRDIGQVLQVPETITWPVRHTGSHGAGRTVTRLVTPALVSRAHARGMQVHVWTVDDADAMRRLLDLGVDGLMTDLPAVLKAALTDRGAWY